MTDQIEDAIKLLVKATDYTKVVNDITRTVEATNKVASDYPGCLGALVQLGVSDRDAFEKVIRRVEQERLVNPEIKRKHYQCVLMRKRRARFSKMEAIARLKKPDITPAQLKTHIQHLNKAMNAERKAHIDDIRDDEGFDYNEAVATYWENVDKQLDETLAQLRKAKL